MGNSFIFPYGITLDEYGTVNIFPAARVLFQSGDSEWISLFLVVDSGAKISALPKSDAASLGIIPEEGAPISIKGVGVNMIDGWQHEVVVRLGDAELHLPIVFLDQQSSPRVLGREGVFDRFTVIFEEMKQRSGFLQGRESQSVSRALDIIKKK